MSAGALLESYMQFLDVFFFNIWNGRISGKN